jgi:2-oxoglutarate ferredoxin oxidoreductase subunit beta
MRFYHDTAKIEHGANTKDIDISYQTEIVVGKFVDKDKPDFFTNRNTFLQKKLGDKYIPYKGPNNGH